jgi:hypothetical protein
MSQQSITLPDLDAPEGWHYGIGERSESYYTTWLYTDKVLYPDGEHGWEAQVCWDKPGQHHVQFIPIEHIKQNGDYRYGYPEYTDSFDSARTAHRYLVSTASSIR